MNFILQKTASNKNKYEGTFQVIFSFTFSFIHAFFNTSHKLKVSCTDRKDIIPALKKLETRGF